MKTSTVIPIAILIGGAIVAAAVYFTTSARLSPGKYGKDNPAAMRPVSSEDHILGNPGAPVKVVEYSDFDCEYCSEFQQTMHRALDSYGPAGNVAWIFREFPLTELHPDAFKTAVAAECVAKTAGEDAFWKFTDLLYAHQPVAPSSFGEYARQAGADPSAVASCIVDGSMDARVTADRENALEMNAPGTPYAIIVADGAAPVVISSSYPYNYIKQQIDTALSIAGKRP